MIPFGYSPVFLPVLSGKSKHLGGDAVVLSRNPESDHERYPTASWGNPAWSDDSLQKFWSMWFEGRLEDHIERLMALPNLDKDTLWEVTCRVKSTDYSPDAWVVKIALSDPRHPLHQA